MVRHVTPLVVAPALPCAERLEVLIARARLHHRPVGLDPSEESLLTALLSFDPSDRERRAARMVSAAFIAADCAFECAPPADDLGAWLAGALHALPPSVACIVIALPTYEVEIERQLRMFVDIQRTGHHDTSLIVGVATAPADWGDCELDGFVLAEPEQRIDDALRVFSMFAALMAPGLTCCLDPEDFLCALGTATNPSRIAEAVFLVGSACLLPVSHNDQRILHNATGVAVMPSKCPRLATQALLTKRVRAHVKPYAALTLVAPWG